MTIDRTSVKQYHDSSNAHIRKVGRMTGPASYATGGDPLTPGELGVGVVDLLLCEPFDNGTAILLAVYQHSTSKLKFYDMAGAEVTDATNLSAYAARFEMIGI